MNSRKACLFGLSLVVLLAFVGACAPITPAAPVVAPVPATVTSVPAAATAETSVVAATDAPVATEVAVLSPTAAPTVENSPTVEESPTVTATEIPTETPAPTETALPTATNTPAATDTPMPTAAPTKAPTHTRVPATAKPKLPPLLAALNKTDGVKTLKYHDSLVFSDPHSQTELMTIDGERQGENARFTAHGLLAILCGCDGAQNILYGDQFFTQKGDSWTVRPRTKQANQIGGDNSISLSPTLTEFSKVGEEAVDGQNCDVYTLDKDVGRKVFEQNNIIPAQMMSSVVNVEVSYWVCPDGYVHQKRTRADFLRPDGGTNISKEDLHYFDFGAPVEITPPANAQPAS